MLGTLKIRASELGALAGASERIDAVQAAEQVWQRALPVRFDNYIARHGHPQWHKDRPILEFHRKVLCSFPASLGKEEGDRQVDLSYSLGNPRPVPRLLTLSEQASEYLEKIKEPAIRDQLRCETMMELGRALEDAAILQWEKDGERRVLTRECSFMLPLALGSSHPLANVLRVVISGRADGVCDDDSIYEGKIRWKSLRSELPDHEYAQVQAYLHGLGKENAHFVQTSRCLLYQSSLTVARDTDYFQALVGRAVDNLFSERFAPFHSVYYN